MTGIPAPWAMPASTEGACRGCRISPAAQRGSSANSPARRVKVATCPLLLARATQATPRPVGLQLGLSFDASRMRVVGIEDEFCPGGTCSTVSVPPAPIWPTGHTLGVYPTAVDTWPGEGGILATHLGAPLTPLTESYLDAGMAQGEPHLFTIVVELLAPATNGDPARLFADDISGTSELVGEMVGRTIGGVVVLDTEECAACDDGDACTTETCDPASGACTHTPLPAPCLEPAAAICTLTGSAGETQTCTLTVARSALDDPAPIALQLDLGFDPAKAQITSLGPASCNAVGCGLYSEPDDPATWTGTATLLVTNLGSPLTVLTDAWAEGDAVEGDPLVVSFDIQLIDDATPASPVVVTASQIGGTGEGTVELTGTLAPGPLVLLALRIASLIS